MNRTVLLLLSLFTLLLGGEALALSGRDFWTAYDLLRNALCTLKITCLLPRDVILPMDWEADVKERLEKSGEVLIIGDISSFKEVLDVLDAWMTTEDEEKKARRPQVFAVVPQEQVGWFNRWMEDPEIKGLVQVASSSSEEEPLSVVGRIGLPFLILDNRYIFLPTWWQLDGPIVRQVLTWGRLVVDIIRSENRRKKEVK